MQSNGFSSIAGWESGGTDPVYGGEGLLQIVQRFREPVFVIQGPSRARIGVAQGGRVVPAGSGSPLLAALPALYPEWLGDRSFQEVHGTRFSYIAGAMANGIATTRLVKAMASAGMLGFFGAAGLGLPHVEAAIDEMRNDPLLQRSAWGSNLIHSPQEPDMENAVVDLYLRSGVRRVSASAYMALTRAVVRYAASGLTRDAHGRIQRKNYLFAKISRPEVARRFLSPAPQEMLRDLVEKGLLTQGEAELARQVPVAEDIIVESDSGGHTDNQPLGALFPVILALRDELSAQHGYQRPVRVGAAGGLGTPGAVASAYALGAAFVLTGSVNQGAVESGLSEHGRKLLAQASLNDVDMAAAADMFELGVKVQVLKRGTLFSARANQLYRVYHRYDGLEDIPAAERENLEKRVLGSSFDEIWAETRGFWTRRDAREVTKAEQDPKHKMALCFRWYLGMSSRWAIKGEERRKIDYQIWCGPAMGSFNDWVKGSFLEAPESRGAVQIALNLLDRKSVV